MEETVNEKSGEGRKGPDSEQEEEAAAKDGTEIATPATKEGGGNAAGGRIEGQEDVEGAAENRIVEIQTAKGGGKDREPD